MVDIRTDGQTNIYFYRVALLLKRSAISTNWVIEVNMNMNLFEKSPQKNVLPPPNNDRWTDIWNHRVASLLEIYIIQGY